MEVSGPHFSVVAALLHQRPDLMSDDPYEGFLKAKEAALLAELASVRLEARAARRLHHRVKFGDRALCLRLRMSLQRKGASPCGKPPS